MVGGGAGAGGGAGDGARGVSRGACVGVGACVPPLPHAFVSVRVGRKGSRHVFILPRKDV